MFENNSALSFLTLGKSAVRLEIIVWVRFDRPIRRTENNPNLLDYQALQKNQDTHNTNPLPGGVQNKTATTSIQQRF